MGVKLRQNLSEVDLRSGNRRKKNLVNEIVVAVVFGTLTFTK